MDFKWSLLFVLISLQISTHSSLFKSDISWLRKPRNLISRAHIYWFTGQRAQNISATSTSRAPVFIFNHLGIPIKCYCFSCVRWPIGIAGFTGLFSPLVSPAVSSSGSAWPRSGRLSWPFRSWRRDRASWRRGRRTCLPPWWRFPSASRRGRRCAPSPTLAVRPSKGSLGRSATGRRCRNTTSGLPFWPPGPWKRWRTRSAIAALRQGPFRCQNIGLIRKKHRFRNITQQLSI